MKLDFTQGHLVLMEFDERRDMDSDDLADWLRENIMGNFMVLAIEEGFLANRQEVLDNAEMDDLARSLLLMFEDVNDAVLFKVRWG